ncbi:hypothetical protein U876_23935 [Aeromonas hydrophila NJ-35]|nr:hypothetical protein U876_23935 [Aeromonas hydrophila NJ-35]
MLWTYPQNLWIKLAQLRSLIGVTIRACWYDHQEARPSLSRYPAALRPRQLKHVIRVASITGRQYDRDVMLLWLTHSTGVLVTESS